MDDVLMGIAASELISVLTLGPARGVLPGIVSSVPYATAGVLGVDVDGLINEAIDTLTRHRKRRGSSRHLRERFLSRPLPPMSQPIEPDVGGEVWRKLTCNTAHHITRLQRPDGSGFGLPTSDIDLSQCWLRGTTIAVARHELPLIRDVVVQPNDAEIF